MRNWISRRRTVNGSFKRLDVQRWREPEAGDTLIEILIALAILTIVGGALVIGLLTSIWASSTYRGLASIDTVLRTAASEATSEIQQAAVADPSSTWPPPTGPFACPSSFSLTFPGLPSGFNASSTSEAYTPATGATSCSNSYFTGNVSWALIVSITVTEPSIGATQTASVIVNDPLAPAVPVGTTADHLAFTVVPTPQAGSGFAVVVTVQGPAPTDAIDTSDFSIVTLGSSPSGLSGCSSAEVAGAITFSNCQILKTGTYTLTAMETSETIPHPTTTSPITVVSGPPSALKFSVSPNTSPPAMSGTTPSLTAYVAFPTQPQITVLDAYGNVVTSDSSTVTLAITAATGANNAQLLACTESEPPGTGQVNFSGCEINLESTSLTDYYTLTATDVDGTKTLTPAVSNNFLIHFGSAYQLAFTTTPTGGVINTPFPVQPAVAVEDEGGNIVTNDSSAITLALSPNLSTSPVQAIPSGAAMTGCTSGVPSNGITTFSLCQINDTADGYTLTATDSEIVNGNQLISATSNPFNVTGPAANLIFTTEPSATATAGAALAMQPQVTVEDASGNVVTSNTDAIILSITPSSGTLLCSPNPVAASGGVANFTGCDITTAGTYTITATDGSLSSAPSSQIVVSPGVASQLVFTIDPSATNTAGGAFGTQPQVSIEDAYGNTVPTGSSPITLGIGTNPGGGTVTCVPNSVSTSNGVANFSGCDITKAGSGYTLTATDTALPGALGTSTPFSIVAASPMKLAFTAQPGNSTGGIVFNPQPQVTIEDAYGNAVTTDASTVILSIATANPSGGTLSGNCTQSNESVGVAQFSGCSINKPGTYTLKAADTDGSTTLTPITSNSITITVGPAAVIVFTTSPSGTYSANNTFPVSVTLEDAGGNVVTSTYSVTLSITPGTGTPGAGINCAKNPVTTSSGVASFTGCSVTTAGSNYTLTATVTVGGTNVQGTSTNMFSIDAGTAAQLVFSTQPASGSAGATLSPVVTVVDAYGNPVNDASSTVTMAIATGPGTLTCNPANDQVTTTTGVAAFSCDITKVGTYTLKATDGALSVTSISFTISANTATQLVFTTQPANSGAGVIFAPVVTVEDAYGNAVPAPSSTVTLAIATGPTGGTLTCNPGNDQVTTVNGVATFSCDITKTGTYTLKATDGALTVTSSSFTITAGAAAQLVFTTQPANSGAGVTFAPGVTVEDAYGNVVTAPSSTVTLSVASGPGALTCNPANDQVTTTNGVATFSCDITVAGTYMLQATDGSLNVTSASFTISALTTNDQLVFTTSPGASTTGSSFGAQPVVRVEDTYGNTVLTNAATITLAINTGTGTLHCAAVAAVNGVATFAGCYITLGTEGSFSLKATSPGLTTGTSASFTVAGAATKLVFTTEPSGGSNGNPFATQPVVTVEDAAGDVVTTSAVQVTLAIGTKPAGGGTDTLTCTTNPLDATNGVATFEGCQIAGRTGTYTITAAATGFTTITSTSFNA
jgi:hypothetical protein